MNRTDFTGFFFDFFAGFLPDWRQKGSGRISTGPDKF
jgi:hypothetical protein